MVAAPGNHDIAARDLGQYPDGLAYFCYWDQPLNGPTGQEGGPLHPLLYGPEANRTAFLQAAGPAYPRMTNFSFDYGNAHWMVLDSNAYVDWTDPGLRAWVERDLAAAKDATWRFVACHHPPFNSSHAHFGDQRMRVLVDLFEAGKVDVVWTGHVHNYQRTFPLTFAVNRGADGRPVRSWTGSPAAGPSTRPSTAAPIRPPRHHLRDDRRRRRRTSTTPSRMTPPRPGSRTPAS